MTRERRITEVLQMTALVMERLGIACETVAGSVSAFQECFSLARETTDDAASLPGHLCEQCLDAPATALVPAPWGGEMGVCGACQSPDPGDGVPCQRCGTPRSSHDQDIVARAWFCLPKYCHGMAYEVQYVSQALAGILGDSGEE